MKQPPLPGLQQPHITPIMASRLDLGFLFPLLDLKEATPPNESSVHILISIIMVTVIYCGFYLSVHFLKATERLKLGTMLSSFLVDLLLLVNTDVHMLLLCQLKLLKLFRLFTLQMQRCFFCYYATPIW